MIETAENLARDYGITREEADAYAARSQQRAAAAWAAAASTTKSCRSPCRRRRASRRVRRATRAFAPTRRLETLAKLRPLMKDGTVTAGNASQQNDAAAACLVVAEDQLPKLGLEPIGFLVGWAAAGCEPATHGHRAGAGRAEAVRSAPARASTTWTSSNSTRRSPARCWPCCKGWDWNDPERLNVNGSGISLGHPIGATGVRILATLLHELRRRGGRYGLETMCIGGGQGLAAVFERP